MARDRTDSICGWELRDPINRILKRIDEAGIRNNEAVKIALHNLLDAIEETEQLVKVAEQDHIIATAEATIEAANERRAEILGGDDE